MMSKRRQEPDDLSEADRRAIAAIRRELDAELGALEPAEPLTPEPSPPVPSPPRPSPLPTPRTRPRGRARAAPLFLLGVVVGGAIGGVTGALTTLLWLRYADRGAIVSEDPAGATRELLPDS